jgi:ADP-ribose pyrophosphatase
MSTLKDYFAFAQANPELFVNPSEEGITILLDENEIRDVEIEAVQLLESQGLPVEWAKIGIVYQDQYLMILRDAVRFPGGKTGTYIRLVDDQSEVLGTIILPVFQKKVLLIRHFRHATRRWHIEIPRGFGTKGLSSEENARKELEEEIGATISRLIPLGQSYPDTGMMSAANNFFYAEVESYGQTQVEEAIIEIIPTAISEFQRMIRENEITDGYTLVAYARASAYGLL